MTIELLDAVPMTPLDGVPDRLGGWHRVELLLLVIVERKLGSPEMVAALRALMRKVARHDATIVDRVRTVLRQLDAQATPTP